MKVVDFIYCVIYDLEHSKIQELFSKCSLEFTSPMRVSVKLCSNTKVHSSHRLVF